MAPMLTYFSHFFSGGVDPTWPHGILLSISVLASFAVGAGIIFESHKYPEAIQRIAMLAVIVGVIVEAACTITLFVFDEGISNVQQNKIIALERRIAPRNLSPSQQQKIVDSLKQFTDVQFVTQWYSIDVEGKRLADQIAKALLSAGFKHIGLSGGLPPDSLTVGVKVLSNEAGDQVRVAVCEALKANDIECTTDSTRVGGGSKTLAIWIGVKAIAEP
jgi:hypothetical protein